MLLPRVDLQAGLHPSGDGMRLAEQELLLYTCSWPQPQCPVYKTQPQWQKAASASLLLASYVVIQIRRMWWVCKQSHNVQTDAHATQINKYIVCSLTRSQGLAHVTRGPACLLARCR
jgi:hypothetical protein